MRGLLRLQMCLMVLSMTRCVTNDTIPGDPRVRTLVLSAVHDELAQRGYREMDLRSLAERAGVSEDAAQAIFVSKESVLVAHLDRMNGSLLALLKSIAGTREPVRDRLREVLLTRVVFRFDMLRPYAAHLEEMREPLLLAMRRREPEYVEAEARVLERLLAEGQRGGVIDLADPVPLARTLLTATSALLPGEANLTPLPPPRELRRMAGELIDVVLQGTLLMNCSILRQESPRVDATAL